MSLRVRCGVGRVSRTCTKLPGRVVSLEKHSLNNIFDVSHVLSNNANPRERH